LLRRSKKCPTFASLKKKNGSTKIEVELRLVQTLLRCSKKPSAFALLKQTKNRKRVVTRSDFVSQKKSFAFISLKQKMIHLEIKNKRSSNTDFVGDSPETL
jgi:hypothetical protein